MGGATFTVRGKTIHVPEWGDLNAALKELPDWNQEAGISQTYLELARAGLVFDAPEEELARYRAQGFPADYLTDAEAEEKNADILSREMLEAEAYINTPESDPDASVKRDLGVRLKARLEAVVESPEWPHILAMPNILDDESDKALRALVEQEV